jgi:hypothetical protein
MDITGITSSLPATIMRGLILLLVVDTALGAASALAGGSFAWEYLYAVGRTKGLVLFQIFVLMFAGYATPLFNFDLLGLDMDPFTLLGMGLAIPLASSLIASIGNNVGKRDITAPQGVSPVNVQTPPDKK